MGLIKKMRRQFAVYWPPIGTDDEGEFVYGDPVEIKCRWEDDATDYIDAKSTTEINVTKVYCDRVVKVGGMLWRGRLADLSSQSDPKSNENASEILKYSEIPNLKAKDFLRIATLGKEALSLIKRA